MIYFLKNNDKVKIGYSNRPLHRISSIQTSNPDTIECLLLIDGGYDKENELQEKFMHSKNRHNGEWFLLSQDILDFVSQNQDKDRRYEYGLINEPLASCQQIQRLRKENNLALKELGKMVGLTASGVKEMEKREENGNITINKLDKVASTLGYKFEYRFIKLSS